MNIQCTYWLTDLKTDWQILILVTNTDGIIDRNTNSNILEYRAYKDREDRRTDRLPYFYLKILSSSSFMILNKY